MIDTSAFEIPGYEVADRIGAGGFGEVFRARDTALGREVAIKVLHERYSTDAEASARFVAEARAVGRLSHPGIVHVYAFGELPDGRRYFAMELVHGKTLRDVLRERGRLDLAEALPILRGIAEAVDAAHAAGIAHRDLKPDNVFVVDDGRIKLIDFGLAKLSGDEVPVTKTGAVFGTPLYMSPEQCRGNPVDVRTDCYSFGVLAYHVLVGEPPWTGDALEVALHHLNDAPPVPSSRVELPSHVDRTLLAAMAKDPAERPRPLRRIVDALAGDITAPKLHRRWLRAMVLAGAGVAVVAGVASWVAVGGGDRVCTLGADRLTGIWDDAVRARIDARFAAISRPDVAGVRRMVTTGLDGYAATWARLWDATCDDAFDDALLRAQKQACLESALLALRGFQRSLATADLAQLAEGVTSNFVAANTPSLDDCSNESMLREQRPAPPAAKQEAIAKLGEEWRLARSEVRRIVNAGRGDGLDAALARMASVGDRLEALGASGANETVWLASYVLNLAIGERALGINNRPDPARSKQAHEALATAIRRAEAAHEDSVLADALYERARLEIATNIETPVVEATIARAEAAAARAGKHEHNGILWVRGRLLMRDGKVAEGIAILQRAVEHGAPEDRPELVDALSRAGRHAEAIATARAGVAAEIAALGDTHVQVADARLALARAHEAAGRSRDALDELVIVEALYDRIGEIGAQRLRGAWTQELAAARSAGDVAVVARIERKLATLR